MEVFVDGVGGGVCGVVEEVLEDGYALFGGADVVGGEYVDGLLSHCGYGFCNGFIFILYAKVVFCFGLCKCLGCFFVGGVVSGVRVESVLGAVLGCVYWVKMSCGLDFLYYLWGLFLRSVSRPGNGLYISLLFNIIM